MNDPKVHYFIIAKISHKNLMFLKSHDKLVPNQPRRKRQLLDRKHIHRKIVILIIPVIQSLRSIYEGKLRQWPNLQPTKQYIRPLLIERIVDHLKSHLRHIWSVRQEVYYCPVGFCVDLVHGVHYLLPPIAAHEEQRED